MECNLTNLFRKILLQTSAKTKTMSKKKTEKGPKCALFSKCRRFEDISRISKINKISKISKISKIRIKNKHNKQNQIERIERNEMNYQPSLKSSFTKWLWWEKHLMETWTFDLLLMEIPCNCIILSRAPKFKSLFVIFFAWVSHCFYIIICMLNWSIPPTPKKNSYLSPRWPKLRHFFPGSLYSLYFHVPIDQDHIWPTFMAKIEKKCKKVILIFFKTGFKPF